MMKGNMENVEKIIDDLDSYDSFDWEDTPQGYDYWFKVKKNLIIVLDKMQPKIIVQYMTDDGFWKDTEYHINNLKKNYRLFKGMVKYDYYCSDASSMIYRVKKCGQEIRK